MKLRNKKTGEIVDLKVVKMCYEDSRGMEHEWAMGSGTMMSIEKLENEWEDYEERWYITADGDVRLWHEESFNDLSFMREIGNYFETREEAEKAVERLKAWKRLKDKGFRFTAWKNGILLDETIAGQVRYEFPTDNKDDIEKDLDLLFGGEDEVK